MINNKLKHYRTSQGLTLKQLGEWCGVAKSHIHALEKGAEPRIHTAYAIAKALDVTVYDIWPDPTEFEEITIVKRVVRRGK